MEIRIIETSRGDYMVEAGNRIESMPNPFGPGYIMPGLIVYRSSRADTLSEAKRIAKQITK